jgi:hypothetical protein
VRRGNLKAGTKHELSQSMLTHPRFRNSLRPFIGHLIGIAVTFFGVAAYGYGSSNLRCHELLKSFNLGIETRPFGTFLTKVGTKPDGTFPWIIHRTSNGTQVSEEMSPSHPDFHFFESHYLEYQRYMKFSFWGPLGLLHSIIPQESRAGRPRPPRLIKNEVEYARMTSEVRAVLNRSTPENTERVKAMLTEMFTPTAVTSTTTGLTHSFIHHETPRQVIMRQDPVVQAFKTWIYLKYLQTINFTYAKSGLEDPSLPSLANVMDEPSSYLNKFLDFRLYLVFDNQVYQKFLEYMGGILTEYETTNGPEEKKKVLYKFSDQRDPFHPLTGVALIDGQFLPARPPVELKRYFRNDDEDPLGLSGTLKKDSAVVRLRLLLQVIGGLPANTRLEIHAHSPEHVKLYKKFGFNNSGPFTNSLYPNAKIYLLTSTREVALTAIGEILKKHEAASPD